MEIKSVKYCVPTTNSTSTLSHNVQCLIHARNHFFVLARLFFGCPLCVFPESFLRRFFPANVPPFAAFPFPFVAGDGIILKKLSSRFCEPFFLHALSRSIPLFTLVISKLMRSTKNSLSSFSLGSSHVNLGRSFLSVTSGDLNSSRAFSKHQFSGTTYFGVSAMASNIPSMLPCFLIIDSAVLGPMPRMLGQ